ncbi:MAG: YgjV family protein [Firmicutes bacterium]|nr:YgjV family protein [Bacillota bacterium]
MFINEGIPIALWIVSQVFGVLVIAAVFITFQMKRKTMILWGMFFGNLFSVGMHAFLGNWAVVGISAVTALKSLAFIYTTVNKDKMPKWISFATFLLFSALAIFAVILTNVILTNPNANWYDWVMLGAQLFANWTQWAKEGHWIRFSSGAFSVLGLYNNILFMNVMGLVIAGVKLGSIGLYYIRLHASKKLKAKPPRCRECPKGMDSCEKCPYRMTLTVQSD